MTGTAFSSQSRILCVDDDGIQLKLLTRGFKPHGFEVVTGTDGIDGLRQFQAYGGDFRAILSDYDMPNLNGLEFIKQVRALGYKGQVLMMSATLSSLNCEATQGYVVSGFFHKPFDITAIVTILMEAGACR
jgi:DNA-binding NtrC family response regulator